MEDKKVLTIVKLALLLSITNELLYQVLEPFVFLYTWIDPETCAITEINKITLTVQKMFLREVMK